MPAPMFKFAGEPLTESLTTPVTLSVFPAVAASVLVRPEPKTSGRWFAPALSSVTLTALATSIPPLMLVAAAVAATPN